MARGYPRFLYSNPKNTKSEGPFVVHTLFPKAVFKIHRYDANNGNPDLNEFSCYGGYFHTEMLDSEECSDEDKKKLVGQVHDWFFNQPEFKLYKK